SDHPLAHDAACNIITGYYTSALAERGDCVHPDTSMIGHDWARDLLRRAASRGRLGHAYLLVGPPSVGKTALALELAGLLVCAGPEPRPCGQCRACRNLLRGTHPDVRLLERA